MEVFPTSDIKALVAELILTELHPLAEFVVSEHEGDSEHHALLLIKISFCRSTDFDIRRLDIRVQAFLVLDVDCYHFVLNVRLNPVTSKMVVVLIKVQIYD